ncbi:MAG: patatin-like phospholipase family protein [Cyclobacteriaceae bacterium]|nr:patatin-like phospholipase family protein [Cyclobacteriaceae bacterium]
MKEGKPCVLALSSGGARGFAHIGVIEGLIAQGWNIKAVSGCSMGALVAGVYASGKLEDFKNWACNLEKSDVFRLYDFIFSTRGIMKGEKVFNEIKKFVPDTPIESLPIPFSAVGTDLRNKKQVIFNKGSLYDAFRASSSIPGVMKPMLIEGQEILDGGILNPLPVDLLPKSENTTVIAVDVCANLPFEVSDKSHSEILHETEFKNQVDEVLRKWFGVRRQIKAQPEPTQPIPKQFGFFELLLKSNDLMQDRLTEKIIEIHKPDVVIKGSRDAFGTFDFYKAREIIDYGRKIFEESAIYKISTFP